MKSKRLFQEFIQSEKSGGIILILATLVSMFMANSFWGHRYQQFWETTLGNHSITEWINDAGMTFFFVLIGLELKREWIAGELSDRKAAILPVFGAIGGMLVPAVLFLFCNWDSYTQRGAGIPMATDIAFAIGILSIPGKRIPLSVKLFLTTLAVIDDLGAILVIALFYSDTIHWMYLAGALGVFGSLWICNHKNIRALWVYLAGGYIMWYCMLHSGIHATLSGVLVAMVIPFSKDETQSPSHRLQHILHTPIAFLILPLFALANTAIAIHWQSIPWNESNVQGIIAGLLLGKPIGILFFSWIALSLGWSKLPKGIQFKQLTGIGILGGIGFTMSIFITLLAYTDDASYILSSKMAIIIASCLSGIIGYIVLLWTHPKQAD